jgi:hypothetical protein
MRLRETCSGDSSRYNGALSQSHRAGLQIHAHIRLDVFWKDAFPNFDIHRPRSTGRRHSMSACACPHGQ